MAHIRGAVVLFWVPTLKAAVTPPPRDVAGAGAAA